jgi:hypothetical protein
MPRGEWIERSIFIPTTQQQILVGKESRRIMHLDERTWRGGANEENQGDVFGGAIG